MSIISNIYTYEMSFFDFQKVRDELKQDVKTYSLKSQLYTPFKSSWKNNKGTFYIFEKCAYLIKNRLKEFKEIK